jgi:hypothetical protein
MSNNKLWIRIHKRACGLAAKKVHMSHAWLRTDSRADAKFKLQEIRSINARYSPATYLEFMVRSQFGLGMAIEELTLVQQPVKSEKRKVFEVKWKLHDGCTETRLH